MVQNVGTPGSNCMKTLIRDRFYYGVKPYLPWTARMNVRRWFAKRKRARVGSVWPIFPGSERPPEGWPGWPEGKRFAVILTHDVEGQAGLDNCRRVAELEARLGFRSAFNFVPEGEYRVTEDFRKELVQGGFEVGVHDLHHDGSLFQSRSSFFKQAERINHYLKNWNAVGFRAGFMRHNLQWQHVLQVQYDCSTFDTDPFEPQPEGERTIFPFWVPRLSDSPVTAARQDASAEESGYAELPYTLQQDSTAFLLFAEKTTRLWEHKLDWVAQNGGMVLVNVHPDYMNFGGRLKPWEYPAGLYEEFLRKLKARYEGEYWHVIPRRIAEFVRENRVVLRRPAKLGKNPSQPAAAGAGAKKIWIDLENTPHIPFFKPVIRELEKRDFRVVLTARDAYQTCEMATRFGFTFTMIGKHYGRRRLLKFWGLLARSSQLLPFALREKPCLALNHGSRTQNLICNLLGIPTVTIMDYEHSQDMPLARPLWEITPAVVSGDQVACRNQEKVLKYPGIKEDVYVPDFKPDPSIVQQLGLGGGNIIVTVRPPATEAHYHNPESDVLFADFMNRVGAASGVKAVLLPRNKRQETEIRSTWPQWFATSKVIIPDCVVDGLNLLWHSDLAVSGGGTMNREAAALGVPVYSIFRGTIGAVDRQLQAEGRLKMIETREEIHTKILLQARKRLDPGDLKSGDALGAILKHVQSILESHKAK